MKSFSEILPNIENPTYKLDRLYTQLSHLEYKIRWEHGRIEERNKEKLLKANRKKERQSKRIKS